MQAPLRSVASCFTVHPVVCGLQCTAIGNQGPGGQVARMGMEHRNDAQAVAC